MNYRDILGNNISRLRHAKGLKQKDLAEQAGLSKSFVAMVERSEANISLDKLVALAGTLGVDPYVLLLPTENSK